LSADHLFIEVPPSDIRRAQISSADSDVVGWSV
jgi:hypothetical protein